MPRFPVLRWAPASGVQLPQPTADMDGMAEPSDQPQPVLVLRGDEMRAELHAAYRRYQTEHEGVRAHRKGRLRLPYFLWVRHNPPGDMDRIHLRMVLTVIALLVLGALHAPWWAYPTLIVVAVVVAPYDLLGPRSLILWEAHRGAKRPHEYEHRYSLGR